MQAISTIEEIRKTRTDISRKCDFDPGKLVAFYMERQNKKINANNRMHRTSVRATGDAGH